MTAVGPIVITTTFPNLVASQGVNVGAIRSSTPIAKNRVGWALPASLERPDYFVADLGDGPAAVLLATEQENS
ncbi:hypothetical protein CH267_15325 [Rhodococcus sp. 06-621-2]|nr:hypothetical protein CH267_15325 [Rhodococcus sp. 06-621-2]